MYDSGNWDVCMMSRRSAWRFFFSIIRERQLNAPWSSLDLAWSHILRQGFCTIISYSGQAHRDERDITNWFSSDMPIEHQTIFFPLRPWVHVVPVSELILTWNQILCLNHCNINPRFIFLRNSFFLVQTELTDGTKSHTHIERLISKTTFQRLVPNRSRFTATRVCGRAGGRGLVWVRACGRSLLDLLLVWIRIFFFLTYLIYSHSFLNIFFTPAVWNLPRL